MYWPRVLSMPLGPGPKRMMLVAPGQDVRRDICKGIFSRRRRTENEADDEADGCDRICEKWLNGGWDDDTYSRPSWRPS